MPETKDQPDEPMLTTIDNPYNPFTQFNQWLDYDSTKGYNTCGLLSRIARTSPNLSTVDQAEAIHIAIEEIIAENVMGIHKKVTSKDYVLDKENDS